MAGGDTLKTFKLPITRPEFLSALIVDGSQKMRSFSEVNQIIPKKYDVIYCAYYALYGSSIKLNDISYVSCSSDEDDNEDTVAIRFRDKAKAKLVNQQADGQMIRLGDKLYALKLSRSDKYVYVGVKLTNPEVVGRTLIGLHVVDQL